MRRAARALLLLPLLALPLSCSRREASGPAPGGVRFVVDESRLGSPYRSAELGLSFRPPAGWEALPPGQVAGLAAGAAGGETGRLAALAFPDGPGHPGGRALRPRPAAAFLHPDSGAACLLSALVPAAPLDDPRDLARAVRAYAREVREALSARRVDQGAFRVGGWSVTQLRIVGPGGVVYRLLLSAPRRPPVQLDYLLPAAAFREEVVKLESSIGSLAGAE